MVSSALIEAAKCSGEKPSYRHDCFFYDCFLELARLDINSP